MQQTPRASNVRSAGCSKHNFLTFKYYKKMAITKPKKPKFRALPKAPKMSAATEAWKRYEQKLKEVNAENQKKKSEYEKKLRAYEAEMKSRERLKEKARSIKL